MPSGFQAMPTLSGADRELRLKTNQIATEQVTCECSAIKAMTDLEKVRPITVDPRESIDRALETMILCGVRLLFVVDEGCRICGTVSSYDIEGEAPIKLQTESRIARAEILVRDVMTPSARLQMLPISTVRRARVGDIVVTMKTLGKPHLLVCDEDGVAIHGLFSATQIGRQLGATFETVGVATTFAELELVLNA